MGLRETLALIVNADASGAVRELDKVAKSADRDMNKAKSATDKWAGRMQVGGAAAVGFAAVAGKALFGFAQSSEEAELADRKLQNTLKNSPQLAGVSASAFNRLADSIRETTVVDDEAAKGIISLLGQFGATEQQIQGLTPLVVDLSRKMGIDLDSAAKMVGKSINGKATALQKAGVQVDATALKTDAYAATVDALRGTVGGFAKEEGKTFSGQMAILKNELGEVAEGIGGGVVDAITTAVGPAKTLAGALGSVGDQGLHTAGVVATVGTAALGVAGAASFAAGTALKYRQNLADLAETAPRTAGALRGLGKGAAVAAAAVAGLEIFKMVGTWIEGTGPDFKNLETEIDRIAKSATATGAIAKTFGDDFQNLGSVINDVGDSGAYDNVKKGFDKVGAAIDIFPDESINEKNQRLRSGLDKLDKQLAQLATDGGDNAKTAGEAFNVLSEVAQEQGVSVETVKAAFNDYISAVGDADKANKGAAPTFNEATGLIEDEAAASADAAEQAKAHADALKEAEDALRDQVDAIFAARDAQRGMTESHVGLNQAFRDLAEAEKTAREEGGKNVEANEDLLLAYGDVEGAIDDVRDAAKKNAEEQRKLSGQVLDNAESIAFQKDALIKLRDTIAPDSPFRAYLEGLIAELDRAALNREGTLNLRILANGKVLNSADFGGSVSIGGNAKVMGDGGTVRARPGGTVAVLAERGRDETVVDTRTLQAAMARQSGGGGEPMTINLILDGKILARAVVDENIKRGRRGAVLT